MGLAFHDKAHGAQASILTMQLFWSSRGHLLLHLQGGLISSQLLRSIFCGYIMCNHLVVLIHVQGGAAPAPAPMMAAGPPPVPKASDALGMTNSSLNQPSGDSAALVTTSF